MNIGFVSSWLHRGATYVTVNYMKMLSQNNLYVYARGGEYFDNSFKFENAHVYKAKRLEGIRIDYKEFIRWLKKNNINIVIVNEQDEVEAICEAKIHCPEVIFGAYIDYYTEETVGNYFAYDFLICNTRRHYDVFKWHQQCFYLPWCVDTDLYKPIFKKENRVNTQISFFHSMGMSDRKGTDILIKTFIKYNLGEKSKLIIHTQKNISEILSPKEAEKNNIIIIQKTIPAPGLYYLGDVYVYPTKLDGLGLTIYEALSSGIPVITTDDAPMNEIIDNNRGKLIKVNKFISRSDGYYWPLAYVSEKSLFENMKFYIENIQRLKEEKLNARKYAIDNLKIEFCKNRLNSIINTLYTIDNKDWCKKYLRDKKLKRKILKRHEVVDLFIPKFLEAKIREKREENRRLKE